MSGIFYLSIQSLHFNSGLFVNSIEIIFSPFNGDRTNAKTVSKYIVAGATKPRISKMLNVQESQKTWRL